MVDRNSVEIENNENMLILEHHANALVIERVDVETSTHFLSSQQPVDVDKEVVRGEI